MTNGESPGTLLQNTHQRLLPPARIIASSLHPSIFRGNRHSSIVIRQSLCYHPCMPRAMDGLRVGFALLAGALLCGCGHSETPAYPTWAAPEPENAPAGVFAAYVRAAEQAHSLAPEAERRVYFTPQMKKN